MYKAWGSGSSKAEWHEVMVAGVDVFLTFQTDEAGKPIMLDYAFALCPPDEWLFGHVMDPDILLADYIMEDPDAAMPSGEDKDAKEGLDSAGPSRRPTTPAKKHCKCKHKNRKRSKSSGAASSTW